jgi:hypothetical protein
MTSPYPPTEAFASSLFHAMGRPELCEDARFRTRDARVQNVAEVDRIVGQFTARVKPRTSSGSWRRLVFRPLKVAVPRTRCETRRWSPAEKRSGSSILEHWMGTSMGPDFRSCSPARRQASINRRRASANTMTKSMGTCWVTRNRNCASSNPTVSSKHSLPLRTPAK